MPRVKVAGFSVSLDGFAAGTAQSLDHPLGLRGGEIFQWFFPTRTFCQMVGKDGGETGLDDGFAQRAMEGFGAFILGRNMFGPVRGPWPDESWKGWWGDNPPYHAPSGTASPLPARVQAKRGEPGLLGAWARALAAPLRHRGTLTFILPAGSLPECLDAMAAVGCAASAVLPLWPKPGRPAKLVLVRGVKNGRAPLQLLPGLVLHEADGSFTPAAEAVLRGGAALETLART